MGVGGVFLENTHPGMETWHVGSFLGSTLNAHLWRRKETGLDGRRSWADSNPSKTSADPMGNTEVEVASRVVPAEARAWPVYLPPRIRALDGLHLEGAQP